MTHAHPEAPSSLVPGRCRHPLGTGRESFSDEDLAFYSTWCVAVTPINTLVRVEGQRWAIVDAFETAKTELGLTHN